MRHILLAFGLFLFVALSCAAPTQPVIEITPATATIVSGQSLQLAVTRHYAGGPVEVVTGGGTTYSSSNKNVATVSDRGLITAGSEAGSVQIRVGDASSDAISTASFTIVASRIQEIDISPAIAVVMEPGTGRHFTAIAHLNNGLTQDVTKQVLWASSNEAAASVGVTANDFGLVSAVTEGDTTITATDATSLVQGRSIVFVRARGATPGLAALIVTPNPATIPLNGNLQLKAEGVFADGTRSDLTKIATWSSSNFSIATIDANGLAKGIATGSVTITATGASGTIKASAAATIQ